jgi:hypothetical protein
VQLVDTLCRADRGECDIADHCDGVSADCSEDQVEDDGIPCGEQEISDLCDAPDECTAGECSDTVRPATYVCNPSLSACDPPELCGGDEFGCPDDAVNPGCGSCCAAHGEPGCNDPAVEDCVCGTDPFCCDVGWDALCKGQATACGAPCSSTCCSEHAAAGCDDLAVEECTCALDPVCCEIESWDQFCIILADNLCGADCASSCCEARAGTGCEDPAVEACVCAIEDTCCNTAWDALCTNIAVSMCSAECAP